MLYIYYVFTMLIYYVVLVSGVQLSDSYIYKYILFQAPNLSLLPLNCLLISRNFHFW